MRHTGTEKQNPRSGGFTLLELIIALAIIMIAGSGIFLAFRQSNRRALQNASLQLQADLRYIQRRARIEGRNFTIVFEQANNIGCGAQQRRQAQPNVVDDRPDLLVGQTTRGQLTGQLFDADTFRGFCGLLCQPLENLVH